MLNFITTLHRGRTMDHQVFWHETHLTQIDRERLKGHRGLCLWFTGLSGSGKSTLANELELLLYQKRIHTYILDGDNIRHGLNKDLGFDEASRKENLRRIGEVVKLMVDAGLVIITAFISPYNQDRDLIREIIDQRFVEIFVRCDLETCEERDPKGLYKKARAGEVSEFTGISSPYEIPEKPEFIIDNGKGSDLQQNSLSLLRFIEQNYLYIKTL